MSTPIDQLRDNDGGDNSQMVEGILHQLDQDDGYQQMSPPQQRQPQRQLPRQQQQQQVDDDEYEEFDDYYDQVQERELSTMEQIMSEVKLPLLVVFLVFLTNFGMVNDLLIKNIPRLADGGELSTIGLVAKAFLAGVVFYLVRRFVL